VTFINNTKRILSAYLFLLTLLTSPWLLQEIKNDAADSVRIHQTIQHILSLEPFVGRLSLMRCTKERLPYSLTRDHLAHTTFFRNVLEMAAYLPSPEDRSTLLKIVIERLVELDGHLPEEVDDDTEEEELQFSEVPSSDRDTLVARRNLDMAMEAIFSFVEGRCGRGQARELFGELLPAFECHVLPAYEIRHVQFIMFYLLAQDAEKQKKKKLRLLDTFLSWLWNSLFSR